MIQPVYSQSFDHYWICGQKKLNKTKKCYIPDLPWGGGKNDDSMCKLSHNDLIRFKLFYMIHIYVNAFMIRTCG